MKKIMKNVILALTLAGLTVPGIFAADPPVSGRNQDVAAAPDQPPGRKTQVKGQVVDESGKPVPGAAWKISGTEVLRDGKSTRVIRLGDSVDSFADAEGRFVISFGEPIRFDLQFHKPGFAPAFLYEIAADFPDLKITLKRGESIHGTAISGRAAAGVKVKLRLPSQDLWYEEETFTDANGKFEFRSCAPPPEPQLPPGNSSGPAPPRNSPPKRRWQVVCGDKVVQVDVVDGQPVEPVDFFPNHF